MKKGQVVFIATSWGTKHGGINAFNYDLCNAIGALIGKQYQVICVVPFASHEERMRAQSTQVRLLDLEGFGPASPFGPEHADIVLARVSQLEATPTRWWIGHDVITGPIALRARARSLGSKAAIVHHMDYEAYLPFKATDNADHRQKIELQRSVLNGANVIFAVGTKLARSARQKLARPGASIVELVPGLADVASTPLPNTFSAITFGRMGPENDLLKQTKLAVAAFGRAKGFRGNPLGADARLTVLGLSENDTDAERRELLTLAETYSIPRDTPGRGGRAVAVHGWPYLEDRQAVLEHLRRQSVCMMLSLHEGFGLTGWEAIAAKIPLIVSRNSGLYDTVDRTLGGVGLGCLRVVDIMGSTGPVAFQEEDVDSVATALVETHHRGQQARRDAELLGTILERFCTWQHTATAVAEACEFEVPMTLARKNLERWTPDFLLRALRDSSDVVQDAARRKHLYHHLWARLKDPSGNKKHLILFGGIATALCDADAAQLYADWLVSNPSAHLFICYESGDSAAARARNLDREGLELTQDLPDDVNLRMQIKEQRVLALPSLIAGAQRRVSPDRVHLLPLRDPLTTYVMIADEDVYVTPLFRARSSESLSFFLSATPIQLRLDVLNYMAYHLNALSNNPEAIHLRKTIEEAVASISKVGPNTGALSDSTARKFQGAGESFEGAPARLRFDRLEDLDSKLSDWIENAEDEIVILGALSERGVPPEWPDRLATALRINANLTIHIYLESLNNLFWRGLAVEQIQTESSTDASTISTQSQIQPSGIAAAVRDAYVRQGGASEAAESVMERFIVSEVDIPIYTCYVKVDERIVVAPRSHVPTPKALAFVTTDETTPDWQQAHDAIEFFRSQRGGAQYVAEIGTEKLTVYSQAGRLVHGPIHRRSMSMNPRLETRVVHGFIFDRAGNVLLQYRDSSAYDNQFLWDKSFGGNVDQSQDFSLRDTARRELQEEIFTDIATKLGLSEEVRVKLSVPSLFDCGDWRGLDGILPFRDREEWCSFQLEQCLPFASTRILSDGSTRVERTLYVDLFVYVCSSGFPSEFTNQTQSDGKTVQWVDLLKSRPSTDFTPDLNRYLEETYLSARLAEVSTAIRQNWNVTIRGESHG